MMKIKVNRRTAPVLRYALECHKTNTPITQNAPELSDVHYSMYFVTVARMIADDWVEPVPDARDLAHQLTDHGVHMVTEALRRYDRPPLLKRLILRLRLWGAP